MNNKIENVAAYIRVSTEEQKLHGISLDAQRLKLTEYAKSHNMKIVEWYEDEGVSGRKLIKNRPELQRMIIDAEHKKFDRIIFIKLDRFFRSVAEYHECMKRIDPIMWTATEEAYDLTTANGRLLVNMKLTIAELEADQTSERIKLVNEYKVTTGQPLFGTSSLPMGLKVVTENDKKTIAIDEETAPIVKDIFDYFIVHQNKRQTLFYANETLGTNISYQVLSKLLKNRFLTGAYRNNPNYCPAIIDTQTFDKVQAILERNIKNYPSRHIYKFSGLIKCPACGRLLVGSYNIAKTVNGAHHYYTYRCPATVMRQCTFKKRVFENRLERLLLAETEQFFEREKIENVKISETNKQPKNKISDIQAEIDRLNYSWRTGKIRSVELYEKDYAELIEKLNKVQADKNETKDYSHIETILQGNWKDIYNRLDNEHKRAFWRAFIEQIDIEWTTEVKRIKSITFF